MAASFELGQEVTIRANSAAGTVVGVWHDLHGVTQYNVRYVDNNNRITWVWFKAEEITV